MSSLRIALRVVHAKGAVYTAARDLLVLQILLRGVGQLLRTRLKGAGSRLFSALSHFCLRNLPGK